MKFVYMTLACGSRIAAWKEEETAATRSEIFTEPVSLMSKRGHWSIEAEPRAMLTPSTSSSIEMCMSALQSPVLGGRREAHGAPAHRSVVSKTVSGPSGEHGSPSWAPPWQRQAPSNVRQRLPRWCMCELSSNSCAFGGRVNTLQTSSAWNGGTDILKR